jgi:hypothetical protein
MEEAHRKRRLARRFAGGLTGAPARSFRDWVAAPAFGTRAPYRYPGGSP